MLIFLKTQILLLKKKIKEVDYILLISLLIINNTSNADYFLFDYKPTKSELPGGNAKTFNWGLIKDIKINKPWFLSGGINSKNINNIKKYVIPYGIDISSGVEVSLGIKNNKKIISLIKKYETK